MMLITFCDKQGAVHGGVVIKDKMKRISRVRLQFSEKDNWFILHDDAPADSAS